MTDFKKLLKWSMLVILVIALLLSSYSLFSTTGDLLSYVMPVTQIIIILNVLALVWYNGPLTTSSV